MAQTPSTWDDYVGDGVEDTFQVTFPYQKQQEVFVTVDGDPAAFTFISAGWIQLTTAPASGAAIRVQRSTEAYEPRHEFSNGVPLLPRFIDENNNQFLYVVQEAVATADEANAISKDSAATVDAAYVAATAAEAKADAAVITADAAAATANNAEGVAQGIAGTADAAFAAAAAAENAADEALAVAAAADAKVDAAIVDSAAALRADLQSTAPGEGTELLGRSIVVVDSIKDLLNPSLSGRTDVLVYVRRYWAGLASTAGGGLFAWLESSKTNHDGGVRISPTVPWDGSPATHAAFLAGTGETDPTGSGYWLRTAHVTNRFPTDYGATNSAATLSDNKYVFDHFETKWPGVLADLGGMTFRVSAFPSGARYMNGSFQRISDSKVIDAGWSDAVRVGNRNALVGRNTATNLTTNRHEQSSGKGYNLTALGDGALYNAGNNVKHNTAIGPNALYNNRYARYNIAIGLEALYALTGNSNDEDIGSRNVALGDNASRFNQGAHNIAIGRNAMQVKTDGDYNVHIGSAAAAGIGPVGLDGLTIQNPFPTQGNYKTGVGALSLNWAYADNATAFGAQALENLKGGVNNCAFGSRALLSLEKGLSPKGTIIATGGAGAVTWSRSGNTLTVNNSTHANSVGNVVAIRFNSGVPSNVIGVTQYLTVASVVAGSNWKVTLTAAEAAAMATSGNATVIEAYRNIVQETNDNNVAVGNLAGQALLTGMENVFVGQAAGYSLTSATQTTALGRSALRTMQSGASATNLVNCTGVGYATRVSGNNQVQLGDSNTTTYVYGTVQNRSDIRDKADVADTELGVEFILGLRPVSGVWDMRDDYIEVVEAADGSTEVVHHPKDGSRKRTRRHQWFLAQEVKELCERLGVDFGGLQHHAVNGGDDVYSLGYDEFIPPLTKTVQECWGRLDALERRIAALESKEETDEGVE